MTLQSILTAALLAASPASAASDIDQVPVFDAAPRPDDVAVAIGIHKYRDLPPSDFSAADARIFHDYLVALGYAPRNILLLTDERATGADMRMAFERWLPNQVKPESRVVVYYSGHGSPDAGKSEAYLVPYDGNPNYLEDTAYALKRLHEKLGALQAKEVMVILDACFSGAGGRSVLAKGARPLVTAVSPTINRAAKVAVVTASQDSQISTSSPELGHGIFTYHVLKAIRAGKKTLGGIYAYARPKVEDAARRLNVEQTPSLVPAVGDEGDRFVLAEFTKVTLPEEVKAAEEKAEAALEAERERIRQEKAQLEAERKRLEEDRLRKERELAEQRARMERESRKRSRTFENIPPPP